MDITATNPWSSWAWEISSKLFSNNYVTFKGILAIDESIKKSLQELKDAFAKIKHFQEGNDFVQRYIDLGEFTVSYDDVKPYKGQRLDNTGPVQEFQNEDLYQNECLHKLLQFTLRSLPGTTKDTVRNINVMLSRHNKSVPSLCAHKDCAGGREPDDSEWVAQFLINRSPTGISGGECVIETADMRPITQTLLKKPLDGYIINDRKLCHGATAIKVTEAGAVRDVLILRVKTGLRTPTPSSQDRNPFESSLSWPFFLNP